MNRRNGYRERPSRRCKQRLPGSGWETRAGSVDVQIPKLRKESYFPEFPEPRRASENAMTAVVQEAYIQGVSSRSVDDLVKAMGVTGISKSQVSRLCVEIDERVALTFWHERSCLALQLDHVIDAFDRHVEARRRGVMHCPAITCATTRSRSSFG